MDVAEGEGRRRRAAARDFGPVTTCMLFGLGPAARIWPEPVTPTRLSKLLPLPKLAFA
jgi:hypothetical protein